MGHNRPNSLVSFTETGTRNSIDYRLETPFCFEIPPIETRAIHVKLKRCK